MPLHRHFLTMLENGGRAQRVLNYRGVGTVDYVPRNTAATLLNIKTSAPYIMLCDPDFLFLKPIPRDVLPKSDNEITFDYMGFMQVNNDTIEDLHEPARKAGVDLGQLTGAAMGGAVPHIVPTSIARKVAVDWLKCIEFFATSKDPILWVASMWSLVFTVQRLNLQCSVTRLAITDSGREKMVDLESSSAPKILHFAYGDKYFVKRNYSGSDVTLTSSVWDVKAPEGSMSGFICGYLNEVKRSYDIRYSLRERLRGHMSYWYVRRLARALINRCKRLLAWYLK